MKYFVAIPCMDSVPTAFFQSVLGAKMPPGEVVYSIHASSLVYDARNNLALSAMKSKADRVLWLDSDMVFEPDLVQKLSDDIDEGHEMVSALYFSRRGNPQPIIYKDVGMKENEGGSKSPFVLPYYDYPKNQIFPIKACGFGAVMCTINVIIKVLMKFGLPFSPILGFGEDISFCQRATQMGIEMFCDSRLKVEHISSKTITEADYIKFRKTQKKNT